MAVRCVCGDVVIPIKPLVRVREAGRVEKLVDDHIGGAAIP